jgi:hypothetical protein
MVTDILREVGVPASRSNYARLTLNGKNIGIYVNVERIDRTFIENRLGDAKGELYKVHDGGPGADLSHVGDDPLLYAKTFEVKMGKSRAQLGDLVSFIREIRDTPDKDFAARLRKMFDVDTFVRQMAVLLLSGSFDQYTGWGPHNYYLHRDAETDRWRYLTWDLDVALADRAFGRIAVIDSWHAAWPVPQTPRPLLERIVANEELLSLYRKQAQSLLESHFRPEALEARLDKLYALIREDLEKDPFPKDRITHPTDRSYDDVIASMKEFFRRRFDTAREQLARLGKRPDPVDTRRRPGRGQRQRGPRSGTSTEDAPSELVVARHSEKAVELSFKDNATDERHVIVQRCEGADCEKFENYKGIPGENLTSVTDTQVEAGKTYRYRIYVLKLTAGGPVGTGVSNVVTVRIEKTGSEGPRR